MKYKKQVNNLTPVVKINYSHPLMLLEFVEHLGHVMLLEPFHLPTLFLSFYIKVKKKCNLSGTVDTNQWKSLLNIHQEIVFEMEVTAK